MWTLRWTCVNSYLQGAESLPGGQGVGIHLVALQCDQSESRGTDQWLTQEGLRGAPEEVPPPQTVAYKKHWSLPGGTCSWKASLAGLAPVQRDCLVRRDAPSAG